MHLVGLFVQCGTAETFYTYGSDTVPMQQYRSQMLIIVFIRNRDFGLPPVWDQAFSLQVLLQVHSNMHPHSVMMKSVNRWSGRYIYIQYFSSCTGMTITVHITYKLYNIYSALRLHIIAWIRLKKYSKDILVYHIM